MGLHLIGRYQDLPATFHIDYAQPSSCIAWRYIESMRLPRRIVREDTSFAVYTILSGPFTIPSASGFFQSSFPLRASFLEGSDIRLGRDWCSAVGATVMGCVLSDPSPYFVPSNRHWWQAGSQVPRPFARPPCTDRTSVSRSSNEDVHAFTTPINPAQLSGASTQPASSSPANLGVQSAMSFTEQPASSSCTQLASVLGTQPASSSGLQPVFSLGTEPASSSGLQTVFSSGTEPVFSSGTEPASSSGPQPVTVSGPLPASMLHDTLHLSIGESSMNILDEGRLLPPACAASGVDSSQCPSCVMVRSLGFAITCPACTLSMDVEDVQDDPGLLALDEVLDLQSLEYLTKDQLKARLVAHGIFVGRLSRLEDAKNKLLSHLLYAECTRNEGGSACQSMKTLMRDEVNESRIDAQINILRSVVHKISLKSCRRVFNTLKVDYQPREGISMLRRRLRNYIRQLQRGKEVEMRQRRYSNNMIHERQEHDARLENIRSNWPEQISKSLKDKLIALFRKETSSSALSSFICACCAEKHLQTDKTTLFLRDMPLELLKDMSGDDRGIRSTNPDLNGCLLYQHSIDESTQLASMCSPCASVLKRGCLPATAIANSNFLGDVPPELRDLTPVEEAMISRCRPKSWIVHLRPDGDDNKSDVILPNMQRGLKGNIIIYPQRPETLADVLPPSIDEVVRPICVVFVGKERPSREWLIEKAKPLAVSRERVLRALVWLKAHNPLYKDVKINHDALNDIPTDGILPYHITTVPSTEAQEERVARYDVQEVLDDEERSKSEPVLRPHAFPSVVITDVSGSEPSNELRAAAIRHLKEKGGHIQLPHDPDPAKEFFNPDLFPMAYPTLFPYGCGGMEDQNRRSRLSFKRHVRHLLSLSDSRFRLHYSFLFIVFNILQRREVLLKSSLKVKKKAFTRVAHEFSQLTPEAIASVCEKISSNDERTSYDDDEARVKRLLEEVRLVSGGVSGSAMSKRNMRNQVRAMMIEHGLPSFYITINPADVYNPVVRFLAGEEIDVDDLRDHEQGDYWKQSILVAKDPFAAAQFFNLYLKAFIKVLLGFDRSLPGIYNEGGILGHVKAHFGCVEAQGRGTLHCHMVVWLQGALNPNEIRDRVLQGDSAFAERLIRFLDDSISNSVPPVPDDVVPKRKKRNPCSYRGIDFLLPHDVRETARLYDLHHLVVACQVHRHTATCYKYCRRGEPRVCRFDLDPDNVRTCSEFNAEGELCLRCLDGMVNNFNATILEAMRCNMDIKFIGSGEGAKAITYYITDYITKSQLKTHLAYAALDLAVRRLGEFAPADDDETVYAKRMLRRCAFAIMTHQELSAQQVASYLLEFEDCFTSDQFQNLYWRGMERYIDDLMPSPECSPKWKSQDEQPHEVDVNVNSDLEYSPADLEGGMCDDDADAYQPDGDARDIDDDDDDSDDTGPEVVISADKDGQLQSSSDQLADYIYRGSLLDNICVWDFVSQVCKVRRRANKKRTEDSPEDGGNNDGEADNDGDVRLSSADEYESVIAILQSTSRERPRADLRQGHDESRTKVLSVRHPSERRIAVPIGPCSLPRRDVQDVYPRYCRLMLILFKPWRHVRDLREHYSSWPAAFEAFKVTVSPYVRQLLDNMQILHECKDSRDDDFRCRAHRLARSRISAEMREGGTGHIDNEMGEVEDELDILGHCEEIERVNTQRIAASHANVLDCVDAANDNRLYRMASASVDNAVAIDSTLIDTRDLETAWEDEYKRRKLAWRNNLAKPTADATADPSRNTAVVLPVIGQVESASSSAVVYPDLVPSVVEPELRTVHIDDEMIMNEVKAKWTLTAEQIRAFNIVAQHVVHGIGQDQLRMFINGPGGSGKSQVLHALEDFFVRRGEGRRFRVASFTGIAAKTVSGMTLHSALSLDKYSQAETLGSKTNLDLIAMWRGVDYLFIDEVSMIGCKLMARVSLALMLAKENKSLFGGINIIFAGDFAQLPPVLESRLYGNIVSRDPQSHIVMGKLLWLSVDTVVTLTRSMRQDGKENERFVELLNRLRDGVCNEDDYALLRSRVIGSAADMLDGTDWELPTTVVYDNASKDALNILAVKSFAQATGRELHWYYARDSHKGVPLTNHELTSHLASLSSGKTEQRLGKIPLVLGMRVIVSQNFDVAGGVVNGSVGILKSVRYTIGISGERHLTSCIVQLNDTKLDIPGLDPFDAPIIADSKVIQMVHPCSKRRCKLVRSQVPIQPGYAITAHRAQGQTYERVVIDLKGCKSLEAAYVMVSRAKSLKGLLILRPFDFKILKVKRRDVARATEYERLRILDLQTKVRTCSLSSQQYRAACEELTAAGAPLLCDRARLPETSAEVQRAMQHGSLGTSTLSGQASFKRTGQRGAKRQRTG